MIKNNLVVRQKKVGMFKRAQRGFTLIEVLMAMSLGSLIMASGARFVNDRVDDIKDQATAQYQKQVTVAAERYIKDNLGPIAGGLAVGGAPLAIPLSTLSAANYLSSGIVNSNPYRQTPCIVVRRLADRTNGEKRLEALVTTEGGNSIPDRRVPFVAAQAGSYGGFVPSTAPTTAQGAYGVWTTPIAAFNTTSCSGTPVTANHLAFALFFDGASEGNFNPDDLLYRNVVAGRPDLNTMNTTLNMGGFDLINANNVNVNNAVTAGGSISSGGRLTAGEFVQIGGVATLGQACPTNGLVARDATGSLLSCQSGLWTAPSGGQCVSAGGANLNLIEADGRCYNDAGNPNSPAGGDWFFMEVYRHINTANYYVVQRVMGMTGASAGKVWHRNQQSGTVGAGWSAWVQQADNLVSIWDQPAEGGVVTLTGNDGTKMHIETLSGGKIRLLNSAWDTELASVDQSGNLTLNQSGATNVGYVNPGWAVETWGCSANGSTAKAAYLITDGWAWNGKPLHCEGGTWSSMVTTNSIYTNNIYNAGNSNVNDEYFRSIGKWASQLGGSTVLTGYISHGQQIPLPAGFAQWQCTYSASDATNKHPTNPSNFGGNYAYADASRVVTCGFMDLGGFVVGGQCTYIIACG